jgi:DNA-binding LacI/PurR family transcriptional regulator
LTADWSGCIVKQLSKNSIKFYSWFKCRYMNKATLQAVAKLAGVSVSTASLALNNKPNVLPETRSRVIDAALSIGYPVKDAGNQSTGDNRISLFGMLVKHDFGLPFLVNPFYSHIQMGVENECRKHNIKLLYANVEVNRQNQPLIMPDMIREERLEGLLLLGMVLNEENTVIRQLGQIPIVLVDGYAPEMPFDNVVTDNIQGSRMAVRYLIQQGHTHIGLIGWNPEVSPSIHERRRGYEMELDAHNISTRYIEPGLLHRDDGGRAAQDLLRREPQISALFVTFDELAVAVVNGLTHAGLHVPNDISVVGFDNIDLVKDITPPLTTIHVHKTWMGSIGVRLLLDRIANPNQPRVTVTLDPQLIERNSVCPRN